MEKINPNEDEDNNILSDLLQLKEKGYIIYPDKEKVDEEKESK